MPGSALGSEAGDDSDPGLPTALTGPSAQDKGKHQCLGAEVTASTEITGEGGAVALGWGSERRREGPRKVGPKVNLER